MKLFLCMCVFIVGMKAYAGGCEMACDGQAKCLQECKKSKDEEEAAKKAKPKVEKTEKT